jgi:hypothetical protein
MKSLSEGQIRELLLTAKELAYDEGFSDGVDAANLGEGRDRTPGASTVKEWNNEIDEILKEI